MGEFLASANGYEVEYCNVCEREIELRWDINKDGFQAICPVCGSRLMLCDACNHRYGDFTDDCDYVSSADWCRFRRPADWWKEGDTVIDTKKNIEKLQVARIFLEKGAEFNGNVSVFGCHAAIEMIDDVITELKKEGTEADAKEEKRRI